MSQPSSSPPADNNKANEPDFDHPGDWNDATGVGPVLRAPDGVKNAPLTGDLYVDLDGRLYFGARISMEEGTVWSPVPVEGQTMVPRFNLGEFTITLQKHPGTSVRCAQARTYPLREGAVIGDLIKPVIDDKMYHFGFLPYGSGNKWKGCGDFMWWGVLCRSGIITSPDSEEAPDSHIGSDLTRTYAVGNAGISSFSLDIGRGWYFSWCPIDDDFTPDHFFDDSTQVNQRVVVQ